jgi:elongation factor P
MIQATQLKKGMCIKHADDLWRIVEAQHKTPGNLRGMVQARIRNLKTGAISDHRFRSVDMVERAILDETEMEYLYRDGDMYHFMNNETFEQVGLSAEMLGDAVQYLIANLKLAIEFYEERPVGIELPLTVEMKVVETEPAIKGASV